MVWSENGFGDPAYQVPYGRSTSPLGLFAREGVVLRQRDGVGVATGHNIMLRLQGTDMRYVVYHRRQVGEAEANSRVIAMD